MHSPFVWKWLTAPSVAVSTSCRNEESTAADCMETYSYGVTSSTIGFNSSLAHLASPLHRHDRHQALAQVPRRLHHRFPTSWVAATRRSRRSSETWRSSSTATVWLERPRSRHSSARPTCCRPCSPTTWLLERQRCNLCPEPDIVSYTVGRHLAWSMARMRCWRRSRFDLSGTFGRFPARLPCYLLGLRW